MSVAVVVPIPVAVVFAKVALAVAVPTMIVLPPSAITLPIALEEALSIMAWRHPARRRIGRTSPITVVPLVMISDRVPVAVDPVKIGARADRAYA